MARRFVFADHAWADYQYSQQTDRKLLRRLNTLIDATMRELFAGVGKPEPLRGDWSGAWSRRLGEGHRLVYEVQGNDLVILQCRYHYRR